jgi:hypothetical protein
MRQEMKMMERKKEESEIKKTKSSKRKKKGVICARLQRIFVGNMSQHFRC